MPVISDRRLKRTAAPTMLILCRWFSCRSPWPTLTFAAPSPPSRDDARRHPQPQSRMNHHPSTLKLSLNRRTVQAQHTAMSSISGTPREDSPPLKRRRTDSGDDSPTRRESDGGEGRRTDGDDTRDASLAPRRSPSEGREPYKSRSVVSSRASSRRRPRSYSDSRSRSQSSDRTRTDTSPSPAPPTQRQKTPPTPSLKPDYRPRLVLHGHMKPVSQVRISPDGRFIASASADATVKIWDATTGQHMDTLVGHIAGVSCLAWGPDSNTIATGSDDKAIRLWDRVTGRPKTTARRTVHGQEMAPLRGHHNYIHCLAFSPKGNILASGSYDEAVFLWDVRAGRLMRSLPAHSDPVSGIDFCCDGTLVASCSTDGLMYVLHHHSFYICILTTSQPNMGHIDRPMSPHPRPRRQPRRRQRLLLPQRALRPSLQPRQLHPPMGLRLRLRQEDIPGSP